MKLKVRHFAALSGAVLVFYGATAWAEMLDGTKWKIKVVPSKTTTEIGQKEFEDELTFADDRFTSAFSLSSGFAAAKYAPEDEEYEIEWEAEQVSEKEGSMFWTGAIVKSEIEGKIEWRKKDGTSLHFRFQGKKE